MTHNNKNSLYKKPFEEHESFVTDLNIYIQFFKLLKKKRIPEHSYYVEQVILDQPSYRQRIEQIKLLDDFFEKGKTSQDIDDMLAYYDDKKCTFNLGKKQKYVIKKVYNYLFFLIFEYYKFKNFQNKTKIINVYLWNSTIDISNTSIKFLKDLEIQLKTYLKSQFKEVLIIGWKHLDILQYNILVVFYNCILYIIKFLENFNPNQNIEDITKNLENFLPCYFAILFDPKYKIELEKSFSLILDKTQHKNNIDLIQLVFQQLILTEGKGITFLNIIIAFYSIQYKRLLSKEILLKYLRGCTIKFNNYFFKNQDILDEIKKIGYDIQKKTDFLEKELYTLHHIDTNIIYNHNQKKHPWIYLFNFFLHEHLWNVFYEEELNDKKLALESTEGFKSFQEDLETYLIRLTVSFLNFVESNFFQSNKISFSDRTTSIQFFLPSFIQKDITELRRSLFDYKNKDFLGYSSPLSLDSYVSYARALSNKNFQKEKKAYILIDKLVYSYKEIGQKLSDILFIYDRIKFGKNEFEQQLFKENKTVKQYIQTYKLECLDYMDWTASFIENKILPQWTLLEYFQNMVYYTFNLVYLLGDIDFYKRMNNVTTTLKENELLLRQKLKIKSLLK